MHRIGSFLRSRASHQTSTIAAGFLVALLAFPGCVARTPASREAAPTAASPVIPAPLQFRADAGEFVLTPDVVIRAAPEFTAVAQALADYIRVPTSFALRVEPGTRASPGAIILRRSASLARTHGTEGYRMRVAADGIVVDAAGAAGAFYAVQTMRQLMPAQIFSDSAVAGVRWSVAAATIEDSPRFRWRGAHLDVSRHFMPVEFVKRYIDLLALHKMNSFHWHLTDDQGWRIEIRKYPRLTEVGAWRSETLVGSMRRNLANAPYDGIRHGGFYTQEQIRDVVEYARQRFVNVVPEIELPGHAQAVIAAYPQLGSTSEPVEVRKVWGVSDHVLNPSDSTVAFMKDVLDEVLQLFPGQFIHIGGDEVAKTQWRTHPAARERMQKEGLQTEEELQSWFIHQFDEFLASRGRRMVGWDEILEGGLAPNAVVMSWRGMEGGIEAARAGHDVIMAPTSRTYFDYYQSREPGEPLAIGGFLPLDSVYAFEPVPRDLEPRFARHVLGAQAQLWTEYMPDGAHVEYMAFPRMSALAEVVWSAASKRNFGDFRRRLALHLQRLDAMRVNYRREPAR
jgi:hexosaminidase